MDWSLQGSSVHGISRKDYWSGLPFPSPEDLPNPGIEPMSPAWQVDSLPLSHLLSFFCLLNSLIFRPQITFWNLLDIIPQWFSLLSDSPHHSKLLVSLIRTSLFKKNPESWDFPAAQSLRIWASIQLPYTLYCTCLSEHLRVTKYIFV